MSLQTLWESPFVLSLGWAIVHSLWQVSIVAVLLMIVLPLLRRRGPQAAYAACCLALCLSLLAPVLTLIVLVRSTTPNETVPARPVIARTPSTDARAIVLNENLEETVQIDVGSDGLVQVPEGLDSSFPPLLTDERTLALRENASSEREPLSEVVPRQSVWLPLIVAVWFVGMVLLSMWNCAAWFAARKLIFTSILPVTEQIEMVARRMAFDLGISRPIQLLQSMIVKSPVVVGAWKPVILIPVALVLQLPPDQLEALLAHELAHVLRQDYLVNLLQTVIETVLFYHPGVWWISSQIRLEREHCCDDIAMLVTEDRVAYAKALAAVTGVRIPAIIPAASGGHLLHRLHRILGMTRTESAHPTRWLAGMTLLLICGLMAGLWMQPDRVAVADSQAALQGIDLDELESAEDSDSMTGLVDLDAFQGAEAMSTYGIETQDEPGAVQDLIEPKAVTKGNMRIRVVDSEGHPLPNSRLLVCVWTDEKGFSNRKYQTDAEGISIVELPKTLQILRIWARKEGHCPLSVEWWPREQPDGHLIPDEFTFPMQKGSIIGGTIKNVEGQPIPNVRIEVQVSANEKTAGRYRFDGGLTDDVSEDQNPSEGPRYTDHQGRWTLNNVPDSVNAEIQLFLTHPDYVSDQRWGGIQAEQPIKMAAFHDQTSTITLERGTSVSGRILDPAGQPVDGAVVIWGEDPKSQTGSQEVRSTADGQYRIPSFPPGKIRVTVVAKGWMPQSHFVVVKPGMPSHDIQLKKGKTLRVQVVDGLGKPLDDVHVVIERWRETKVLYNEQRSDLIKSQIPNKTDEQGVFEWTWAPDDVVRYVFYKQGYDFTSVELVADDASPRNVVMRTVARRGTTISGTVRDAVTGTPVDKFLMIPVNHYDLESSGLERMNARSFTEGKFALRVDRTDIKQDVQIEAAGYRVFRSSGKYQLGGQSDVLDVQLEPAEPYTGRIVGSNNVPIQGANVFVATTYQDLKIFNLDQRIRPEVDNAVVKTGADGEFEIVPQIENYAIVVIADEGYAEVRRDGPQMPGEIQLRPWAKLSGRLVQAGKPVPKFPIFVSTFDVYLSGEPHIENKSRAVTDTDGRFTFERIPPTGCHVTAYTHFNTDSVLTSSHSVPLNPAPGESLQVSLGDEGADLTGQLVVENQPKGFRYQLSQSYLVAKRPGVAVPSSLMGKGFERRQGWSAAVFGSIEGAAYLETLDYWLVKPAPDGKIQISGVEPGEYDLAVNLYGSKVNGFNHPVARRVIPVSIKAGQKQVSLGKLTIPANPMPKVGDLAPDLPFMDAKGNQSHLAAERGKYVLISFWARWCDRGVNGLSAVEQLRRDSEGTGGLVVIGANLDGDIAQARSLIQSKSLSWPQAFLGDWSSSNVPRQFGVDFLPTYVLIDPTGKIAAHTFSLDEVAKQLQTVKAP